MNETNGPRPLTTDGAGRRFDAAARARVMRVVRAMPIVEHLSLVADLDERGRVSVRLAKIAPFHLGGLDGSVLNGGIVLSLLDAAMAISALCHTAGATIGTTQLSAQISHAVPAEGVVARGRVTRSSGRLLFAEASIRDAADDTLVRASGIVVRVGKER